MDFVKEAMDGQVDQVFDKVVDVAKEKVGELFGGGAKQEKEQGIGDMVTDAVRKAAAGAVMDDAADKALSFGQKLFQ